MTTYFSNASLDSLRKLAREIGLCEEDGSKLNIDSLHKAELVARLERACSQ